jgi:hypothetical protein
VRLVVTTLGIGQFVAVQLNSGKTLRGYLRQIGPDHFVMALDRTAATIAIAYADVRQLGPAPQPVPRFSRAPDTVNVLETIAVITSLAVMAVCANGKGWC